MWNRRRKQQARRRRLLLLGGGIVGVWALQQGLQRLAEEDIHGQVVLITGGSRGLGLVIARQLAQEGCKLVICGRDAESLEAAYNDLMGYGADVLAIQCDVSDRAQVESMVAQATQHYGQIDILINNAAVIQVGPIEAQELKDFEDAMNIMYWGVVYPTFAVLPQMRARRKGRIVNVTSIGGKVSVPHLLPYSSAKFAATGFSEGLRAELAKHNITVTTIIPGLMRTGSHLNALFKGDQDQEFAWFGLADTLPFMSISAEAAAQQIIAAMKRGEAEYIVSLPAKILSHIYGVLPGVSSRIAAWATTSILPKASHPTSRVTGKTAREQLDSPAVEAAMVLGERAAQANNQYKPDEEPPAV